MWTSQCAAAAAAANQHCRTHLYGIGTFALFPCAILRIRKEMVESLQVQNVGIIKIKALLRVLSNVVLSAF